MTKTWWRGATLYQIYPRSFQDSNGDGVGDLAGITRQLGHVADLGVDGIWISPFFKSPMDDFGYDVSDYCDVDPLFGTLADFDHLIARAHELGLKVIIDMVLSHTSSKHAWFVESSSSRDNPKADWYVWAEPCADGTPPNNWLSIFGGSAWQWHAGRRQYYLHNFLISQPDVNIHNLAVQDALLAACQFWLDRGVNGFRLDAINFIAHDPALRHNPSCDPALLDSGSVKNSNPYAYQQHIFDKSRPEALTFLRRLRQLADGYGDILLLGEVGDDDEIARLAEYAGTDGPLDTGYCFRFLQDFITRDLIVDTLHQMFERPEKPWPSWAFSNHDFQRVVTRWAKYVDGPQADQAALGFTALLMALPGTVFIYQGEELGLPQAILAQDELRDPYDIAFYPDHVGRDGCRTPIPWDADEVFAGFSINQPWLPIKQPHLARALAQQKSNPGAVYHKIRALLHYRKAQDILRVGSYEIYPDQAQNRLTLCRTTGQGQMLVFAINLSSELQEIPVPGHGNIEMMNGVIAQKETSLLVEGWGFAFMRLS